MTWLFGKKIVMSEMASILTNPFLKARSQLQLRIYAMHYTTNHPSTKIDERPHGTLLGSGVFVLTLRPFMLQIRDIKRKDLLANTDI